MLKFISRTWCWRNILRKQFGKPLASNQLIQKKLADMQSEIAVEALNAAVKQSKDAYELSKERYDKGVTTLESVLNSQRQYNSIRSQQLTIRRLSIENRLSLVLAMGGEIKS